MNRNEKLYGKRVRYMLASLNISSGNPTTPTLEQVGLLWAWGVRGVSYDTQARRVYIAWAR